MGRTPSRLFAIAVIACGCGGETVGKARVGDAPPANTPPANVPPMNAPDVTTPETSVSAKSGSRLSVVGVPFQSQRVWDEANDVWCSPGPAADGAMRCLPDGTSPAVLTDANCTRAVVQNSDNGCGGIQYFADAGGPAGCVTPKTIVYTAGALVAAPSEQYRHGAGACSLVDPSTSSLALGPFYEAVPKDPGAWVELTEEVIPVTDSLGVAIWKGTDGSRLLSGFRLLPSGTACESYSVPSVAPDGPSYCVPSLRAHRGQEFADDQCSGPSLGAACAATDLVEYSGGLFETGTTVSPVYFANPFDAGKCTLFPPPTPSDFSVFYEVGPRAKLDRYPALTLVWSGAGRLETRYLSSGGKGLVAQAFRDTKYGDECQPTLLSDGGTWCVPTSAPGFVEDGNATFSDPACTVPAHWGWGAPGSDFGISYPPAYYCRPSLAPSAYSVAPHAGPAYLSSVNPGGGRTCVSAGPAGLGDEEQVLFDFIAPLDPATLLVRVPAE